MAIQDYKELLRKLAERKLQKEMPIENNLDLNSMPMPENEDQNNEEPPTLAPEDEEDVMLAQNREPASKDIQGINKDDVRMIQDLNMLDKINMRRQGLDPWNPDDIRKFKAGQG